MTLRCAVPSTAEKWPCHCGIVSGPHSPRGTQPCPKTDFWPGWVSLVWSTRWSLSACAMWSVEQSVKLLASVLCVCQQSGRTHCCGGPNQQVGWLVGSQRRSTAAAPCTSSGLSSCHRRCRRPVNFFEPVCTSVAAVCTAL